jgi:hypothetical protein
MKQGYKWKFEVDKASGDNEMEKIGRRKGCRKRKVR